MKMLLVLLFFVFSIMFVVPSYALSLENKILVSDDEDLIIEFGANTVKYLITTTIITPHIEFGLIRLVDQDILLDEVFDDVSVSVLGNSIAIKSLDVPLIIYARNVGDNNYSVNLYTVENNKFIKQTFTATLETTLVIEGETVVQIGSEVIEEVVTEPLINVLTSHYTNVDEGDPFKFVVKTFDITKYDGDEWANFYGKLDGVSIHAEILGPANQTFKTVDGVTEHGVFEGTVIIRENLWPKGWYTLSLDAFYKGDTFHDDLKFFVKSSFVASGNKAPTANAGPDQTVPEKDGVGGTLTTVQLDGSGSSDPENYPLTYLWTQIGGISVPLSSSSIVNPTFTSPDIVTGDNPPVTLTFTLTVTDNAVKSSSDTVSITITLVDTP